MIPTVTHRVEAEQGGSEDQRLTADDESRGVNGGLDEVKEMLQ